MNDLQNFYVGNAYLLKQGHHFKDPKMYPEIAFDLHHSKTRQKCRFTSPTANPIILPSTFQAQAADDISHNPSELLSKRCLPL